MTDAILDLGYMGNYYGNTECLPQNSKTWRALLDSVVKAHHPSYAIELDGTLV